MSRSIAFLHGSSDLYGASRVVLTDATLLARTGRDVTVVLPQAGPLADALTHERISVEVAPLEAWRRVARHGPRVPLRLPARVGECDVLVLSTMAMASYLPLVRSTRIPHVVSAQEILLDGFGRALTRFVARTTGTLLANSNATAAWLRRHGAAESSTWTAYPVAPTYDPLTARTDRDALRVLLAGRTNGFKGHGAALHAVSALRAAGGPVELTLAGGPFPGQERHLAALREAAARAGPWVRFAGEVPSIRPLLADCDVLIIATTAPESFGLVALEAWAAGRRVVGPDRWGAREAVTLVDGLIYPFGDLASAARVLHRVHLSDSLRGAPDAYAPVRTLCSADRRAAVWEECLRHALGHGQRSRFRGRAPRAGGPAGLVETCRAEGLE